MTSPTRVRARDARRVGDRSLRRPARRLAGAVAVLGLLAAGPVEASPDTLRMALANLMEGPVDMVMAPVVAGQTVARNVDEVGPAPVAPAYVLLGTPGLAVLQVGWGALRTVSGAVLLLPGLALFPFEREDLPEDADVFGQGEALVEAENPLAKDPPWVKWVLPATPATVDARLGITVPYSEYSTVPGSSAYPAAPPPDGLEGAESAPAAVPGTAPWPWPGANPGR